MWARVHRLAPGGPGYPGLTGYELPRRCHERHGVRRLDEELRPCQLSLWHSPNLAETERQGGQLSSSGAAFHEPWNHLTDADRERYRRIADESRERKAAAVSGRGPEPVHPINVPRLDPNDLMPSCPSNGLRALSLFSGGGGLDLGFDRAGFTHVASYELLEDAASTLRQARPSWRVAGGAEGDVRGVDWRPLRGDVDVVHGGPPCQPFSMAGRQRGHADPRDMFPEFVRTVRETYPRAFVAENVPALLNAKFASYVERTIVGPLSQRYHVRQFVLHAEAFGVPQIRRRVIFVGFRSKRDAARFDPPARTHAIRGEAHPELPPVMGVREALGLPDIGVDALAPTLRSTLNGPRNTTSIVSSSSAARKWAAIQVWPNGVAPDREKARAFVAKNKHFRLSTKDVAVLQGFPEEWPFQGPTYMVLGQIGNAVPPPLGYALARSVAAALS